MKIKAYERFRKSYRKLPLEIQKKIERQLAALCEDMYHPSLHTKKIKGREGIWETRVDLHYRITFEFIDNMIMLRNVGNHDEVLKNP